MTSSEGLPINVHNKFVIFAVLFTFFLHLHSTPALLSATVQLLTEMLPLTFIYGIYLPSGDWHTTRERASVSF